MREGIETKKKDLHRPVTLTYLRGEICTLPFV